MKKSMYHFQFRGLTDPPELEEQEAGPFTPEEATEFGQSWTVSKTMDTGRPWVGRWYPVKTLALSRHIVAAAFLVSVVVTAALLAHFLGRSP